MGHMCSVMCRGLFECPTCQRLSSDAYLETRCLLFARIASWHRFGKMWSTALKFPPIQYVASYFSGLCCGRKRSQRKEKRSKTCRRNCRKPLQCRLVSCHFFAFYCLWCPQTVKLVLYLQQVSKTDGFDSWHISTNGWVDDPTDPSPAVWFPKKVPNSDPTLVG